MEHAAGSDPAPTATRPARSTNPVPAHEFAALESRLQERLSADAAELGVPGAAVGITYRGREIVATTGVTSLTDPLPIEPDTLFMIGSTSKTFTATLAMSLYQNGLLDLDRPLHEYLPEVLSCAAELVEKRSAVRTVDLFKSEAKRS